MDKTCNFSAKAHDTFCFAQFHLDSLVAKKDFGSRGPDFRLGRTIRLPQKLLLQPSKVSIRESPRFETRAAAWNRYSRRAVGTQSQNVSTRSWMPRETQRHLPSSHWQPFIGGLRKAIAVKQKLKLHAISLKRRAPKTIPHCWRLFLREIYLKV